MNEKFLGTASDEAPAAPEATVAPEATKTLSFNFFENLEATEATSRCVEFGIHPPIELTEQEKEELFG